MRITEQAHDAVQKFVRPGDAVVDATVGNGYDTLFLAQLVGPQGHVFGLDIQQEALDQALLLLAPHQFRHVTLLRRDHAELRDVIPRKHHGQLAAVMFNLGYLPGGNKAITTMPGTTFTAIQAAMLLLRPEGILSIMIYRGHAMGPLEAEAVTEVMQGWSREGHALFWGEDKGPNTPRLVTLVKLR